LEVDSDIMYRNVKYPLIPEKSGRRRGIPHEGDSSCCSNAFTVAMEERVKDYKIGVRYWTCGAESPFMQFPS
jgi:hypothetical protein